MMSRKFFYYMVGLLLAAMTAACTDDLDNNTANSGMSGNLQVFVPLIHSDGTRAGDPDPAESLTYNATEEECRINSLRLFAFPIEPGKGKLLNEYLGAPGTSFYESGKFDGGVDVATYQLQIQPGTYRIYVVANMEDVLRGQTIDTEDQLKEVVLNYLPEGKPGMPACGNIPMVYEPLEDTHITGDEKTTDIVANLKFTCVKVKLNLIFDAEAATGFNNNGLTVSDIDGNQLSSSSNLVWGGQFYATDKVAESFSSRLFTASDKATLAGSYYADGGWTRDDKNADLSNLDVITINEGATALATPADEGKWMFQGIYYLPERYIKENGQQSYLTVNGKVGQNNNNSYKIRLGHTGGDDEATKDVPTFPRGTYYEIIGNIKTLGEINLDCQVNVKNWEPAEIDADFSHTTLWVNKTNATITSIEEDFISYKSNWVNVEFGCDEEVDGKPLVVEAKRDEENHIITFRINPEIPMSAYGNGTGQFPPQGKTKIWLKANNLKKYLDVDYNVAPLFEVDPLEVIIYYEAGAETNTKVFTWVTNLGGIELPDNKTLTFGKSTIQISAADVDAPKGTFQVTATTNPETTTVHTFQVRSKNQYNNEYAYRDIKVTVRPPVGPYRIYFRAINDMAYNAKFTVHQFTGIREESYGTGDNNKNWEDGWDGQGWTENINAAKHNVYIYSQKGETGATIPKENVWYFNGHYAGDWENQNMTGDTNNPGWYYKDMAEDAEGERLDGDKTKTTIKPGEALMIFYSFNSDGADLHRCPHHMEPGIPLFNYEDREGWVLYDPTSDPYYNIFDDKPIVKDVTYTVYTKYKVNGWACNVGVATDNPNPNSTDNPQFVLWDNNWSGPAANSMTFSEENINGTKWYVTKIKLKAVDGYHEKCIRVQANSNDNGIEKTLFGGHSYEKYNDTGYFDGTNWHPGKPQ